MTSGHHRNPAQPEDHSDRNGAGCREKNEQEAPSPSDAEGRLSKSIGTHIQFLGPEQEFGPVIDASARNVELRRAEPDRRGDDGAPFVVQAGRAIFMVASEDTAWIVAELRFDPESCTFVEVSRARYGWPREAFGSLLSRVAIGEGIEPRMIHTVTNDFSNWLGQQFIAVHD